MRRRSHQVIGGFKNSGSGMLQLTWVSNLALVGCTQLNVTSEPWPELARPGTYCIRGEAGGELLTGGPADIIRLDWRLVGCFGAL